MSEFERIIQDSVGVVDEAISADCWAEHNEHVQADIEDYEAWNEHGGWW